MSIVTFTALAALPQPRLAAAVDPSPIRNVIIIFQENHSFDNVLGYLCEVDARCDGARTGKTHDGRTVTLARAEDLVPPMPHGGGAMRVALNRGAMNGWDLLKGCGPETDYRCYQSFRPFQIPNLAALARRFAISDRTFQNHHVPTWAAHIDIVAGHLNGFQGANPVYVEGQPQILGWGCDSFKDARWQAAPDAPVQMVPSCIPRRDGSGPYRRSPVKFTPTIMTRMRNAGLSWRIYGTQGPGIGGGGYAWSICPTFATCLNTPARSNFVDQSNFFTDAEAGRLPNLSLLTPKGGPSQHNGTSMLVGDNYIARAVDAVMSGPDWDSSAIFILYDDCGCFYDHVAPPPGLSLRVPMVIVSPYAKPGFTDSRVASLSSTLAFTEHNFGLAPLGPSDAGAYDYARSFDYTQTPLSPIELRSRPLPAWERRWLRKHPIQLERGERARSLIKGQLRWTRNAEER